MIKLIISYVLLLSLAIYFLKDITTMPDLNNPWIKSSAYLILVFSLFVIVRYFLLLLFSMLNLRKNIKNDYENFDEKNAPFISILVPCFNEEKTIKNSLKSLIAQDYPRFEIIVIDDGSTDSTYMIAKSMEFNSGNKRLRVLTKTNGGKALALNYGISKSKGDYFLVVDADSKISKDSLKLMIRYFQKDEKLAAVAGSVYVTNSENLWTNLQALEYVQGLNLVRNGQAYFKLVNIVPGPIGLFKKEAVEDVGFYTTDTFAEDCDLTLSLIAKGYKIEYEIDAVSYTEAPETIVDLIKQRYRWTRGILQAILKHKVRLFDITKPSIAFVMWYMVFESVLWPIVSVFANLFIIFVAFSVDNSQMLIYWWIIFTILDVSASVYCLSVTKEDMRLLLYSLYYRLIFVNITNVAKVLSSFEEVFGIEMSWGKLDRKGKI